MKKEDIITALEGFCEGGDIFLNCSSCHGYTVGYDETEVAEKAYKKGWRLNEDEEPLCPECVKPKTVKKKK